ncbi:MAG: hypothetical protein U1E73_00925 [Planctomycetota bacterium]
MLRIPLLLLSLLVAAACGSETPAAPGEGTKTPPPVPVDMSPAPTPEIVAKLEKADAADGKVDKIVEKCAGCSLGMNGNPAHAVKVGGYTLHFCDHCADGKAKDPTKVLTALVVK